MSEGRRYRIIEVIGKGGFGTVYRAEMQGEGGFAKNVALKLLNAEASQIDEISSRLRDEARILGLIHHRAIVRVDGLTTLDGRWAVVMEYVDGVDLRHVLAAGPVPPGPAVEIVGEVAGALYVAHDKPTPDGQPLRLLHRDIKPSNIQITPAGEVKILDFGVARAEFQSREAHTQGMRFGTLRYLAPERLDGIDSAAGDIYALGVVLIECLTGKSFGKAIANRSAHQKRVEDALNRVWSQTRGVSQELVDVCEAMVAYDPNQRLTARDVERVCKELRAILQDDWLGDWAENVVPPLLEKRRAKTKGDKLCGSTITEATSGSSASGYWQKGPDTGVNGDRDIDVKGDTDDPSMIFAKGNTSGNLYRQDTEETAPPAPVPPAAAPYEPTPMPAPERPAAAAPIAVAASPIAQQPVYAPEPAGEYEEMTGTGSRGKTGLLVGVAGLGLVALLGLLVVGGGVAAWYTGALDGVLGSGGTSTGTVAEAPPPPPPPPADEIEAEEALEAPAEATPAATRASTRDTGSPAASTRSSGGSSSSTRSGSSSSGGSSSGARTSSYSGGGSSTRSSGGSVRPSGVSSNDAVDDGAADAAIAEGEEKAFDPEADEDLSLCSNLLNLELMSGMGKLRTEHITCLEKYISRADSLNDKDKASRVLIANAQASNNTSRWEMLVKRHLEEFDRSDPELAYGYAVSLSKKGVRGAQGAIRWSDVALENRAVWSGKTHISRVNTLYQIKALASLALYQQAAEKFANDPSQEASKAEETYRNQTKTYAREWFEYAKASGQDTTRAKSLCDESSGRTDFCE